MPPCEIFRSMSKVVPAQCAQDSDFAAAKAPNKGMLTRSLVRRKTDQAPRDSVVVQKDPPKTLSIALKVRFGFDSTELTPGAVQILDRVAQVFKDDLMRDAAIQIDGHADASGSAAYNLGLSTRRAQAVRDFLILRHGMDPKRLTARGKGETELYDPADPTGGINRRVEFRNISG